MFKRVQTCMHTQWWLQGKLISAYNCVLITVSSPRSIRKTLFACHALARIFTPVGICNSQATFQRFMQITMNDLIFQIMLVCLDDHLIFSEHQTFAEHLERLEIVLSRLRDTGLKVKFEKFHFCRRK